MKTGFRIFLFAMLFPLFLFGNSGVDEFLHSLREVDSKEKILKLCTYQETIYYNPVNEKEIDRLFVNLYKISGNDKEFRAYIDFYNRIKPMFLSEMNKQTSVNKRLKLFQNVLNHYQSIGDTRFMGICYMQIAYDLYFLGSYEDSIENLLKADELFKKAGYTNIPIMSKYLHEMSLVFLFFRQYKKAAELMEISVQLPAVDKNRDIQRYNNLGIAYQNLKHLDKAEKAFLTALEKAEQYHNLIWKALISRNLSEIYLEKGNYEEALQLLKTTLPYLEKEREKEQYSKHLLKIAKANLLMKKDIPQSFALISEAEKTFYPEKKKFYYFGEKQQHEQFRQDCYEVKHRYFLTVNNPKMAYYYLDSINVLKRSQDSIYNSLQIHIAEQKLNIQKKLTEIENERKEKKMISSRLWSIITIIAFVSVIFALLYYITRIRRKKENIEHLYREKVMEEEQRKIKKELHHVKEEIKNYLKNIALKNKQIEELSSRLNDLKKENTPQSSDEIKQTEEKLRGLKILTKEQWEIFRNEFEKMQPDFSKKLKKKTSLSEAEIRLLMLSKLHYSGKEIMGILGISDSAVRVTWHRIRKKLDVSSEVSPEQVVQKIK